jgi:hypothetical protein
MRFGSSSKSQKQNTKVSKEKSRVSETKKSENVSDIRRIFHYKFIPSKQIMNQAFYLEGLECLQKNKK